MDMNRRSFLAGAAVALAGGPAIGRAQSAAATPGQHDLKLGDSLRRSIERGLASSRFGVVVLSPRFFAKEWPQKELDGMAALEIEGRKVILPVHHTALKDVGPAGAGGDALRVGDDTVAGLPDVRAEVAGDVKALAVEKPGEAETPEPERLKMAVDDQPVHGGQRPDDLLRMHLLERG